MTIEELREALVAWATDTCPAIVGTYEYPPNSKAQALPDVAVEVVNVANAATNPKDAAEFQQRAFRVFTCRLSFMVDPADIPAAVATLDGFGDALLDAVAADPTLGGRVANCDSDGASVLFDPPFAEYPDGTTGREAVLSLDVIHPR